MDLVLDFGNTFVKTCIFSGNKIVWKKTGDMLDIEALSAIFKDFPEIKNAIVSTVSGDHGPILSYLKRHTDFFISLDDKTPLPFQNLYKTPSTLGKDRLAAVAGAMMMFPSANCLVIDAGTAITYDFISEKHQYSGGNISPGLQTRFRSLHEFTKRLPLVEKKDNIPFWGDSTETAIIAGVQNGIVFEMEGYIASMQNKYEGLKVILSGGDAIFFENKLKSNIFAVPDLITFGLNFILNCNMKNSGTIR